MINLASLAMAAFFFVHNAMDIKGIPMPVVIQKGTEYKYDEIYSAIYVPQNWQGTCTSQNKFMLLMAKHFNAFLNGRQRHTTEFLQNIASKWKCVE